MVISNITIIHGDITNKIQRLSLYNIEDLAVKVPVQLGIQPLKMRRLQEHVLCALTTQTWDLHANKTRSASG